MARLVKTWQVGRLSYANGLKLQKYLAKLHTREEPLSDTLLCLEHDPVYTIGIRTKLYDETEENKLKSKGAEFFRTNRGGLITFHGPGQLVIYPILNLKNFKPSIKWYVCHIEKTIIHLCKKYNLEATTSPHTGVWIKDNKVCAIGIHGSRFITTHGFALNCNNDLSWFDHIIPCGIRDKGITTLSKELNRDVTIEEVLPNLLDSFSEVFECNYTNFSEDEADEILSKLEI